MRAYLQRTEVRLSTLYRITVSFASGEGLMILFPLFIKDEITGVLGVFIDICRPHAADPSSHEDAGVYRR